MLKPDLRHRKATEVHGYGPLSVPSCYYLQLVARVVGPSPAHAIFITSKLGVERGPNHSGTSVRGKPGFEGGLGNLSNQIVMSRRPSLKLCLFLRNRTLVENGEMFGYKSEKFEIRKW